LGESWPVPCRQSFGTEDALGCRSLVKVQRQFSAAQALNDLIVAYGAGGPVRIGDVGTAGDGVENDRETARFLQETTVGLGVVKQSDANTVTLARALRSRMKELADDFPAGLTYRIASDNSQYVEESINSLLMTILLATGLVALVVLGFLRNDWDTVITVLAIPSSLFGRNRADVRPVCCGISVNADTSGHVFFWSLFQYVPH